MVLPMIVPIMLFGQQPVKTFAEAEALAKAGNFREAADAAKVILRADSGAGSEEKAKTLEPAVNWLSQLGAHEEAEQVVRDAAQGHPQDWRRLLAAASAVNLLPPNGMLVDGVFHRGNYRDRGRHVQTTVRDRVWRLQLLDQARRNLPQEAQVADKLALWASLVHDLTRDRYYGNRHAWRLQALTDLSELPDYDDQTGLDNFARGYPVDEQGNPVFFAVPNRWEDAASDGERLRWVLAQWIGLDGPGAEGRQRHAALAAEWFGVATIAHFGWRLPEDDQEAARHGGIAALHTLKDDETVAHLATGPKRFSLPEEWAFINLWRKLAEDAQVPVDDRLGAYHSVASELINRRQFTRAAEALDQAMSVANTPERKDAITSRLKQIRGNLGEFEQDAPQPAGREATVPLVFRNATSIKLTARRVAVAKLLADTEAYLRSEPAQVEWDKMQIQPLGHRILKDPARYLGKVAAEWEQALEPRAGHWDKRVEIKTPLKEAGAWWIEGIFEGGAVTRTLLWIEDTVIVQTRKTNGMQWFVADAVTGAPIEGATVRIFGWSQEWADRKGSTQPRMRHHFITHQAKTDANGLMRYAPPDDRSYQWLVRATAPEGRQAFLGFEHFWRGGDFERFGQQTRLYTITDRPVYRPDQQVKWQAWARSVGYGGDLDPKQFAGVNMSVEIHDPRGEKILEKDYQADEFGAFGDELTLGAEATLGVYRMSFRSASHGHLGHGQFRVEEYKKPEFEVKVAAPEKPVALGDSFEVKVKADYYFGGPVREGKVKYKVQRSAHQDRWFPPGPWDWLFGPGYGWRGVFYNWYPGASRWCECRPWWPWWPRRSDPPELVASGEAPLNADGTFTVKVDTALAKELHGDEDHRYEIEAEVTDQSRRTIFGKGTVLAARRPFEVYVSLDRGYYRTGESGEIRVHARTLDGRAVKGTGSLKIFRVTYDAEGKPSEEEAASFDLKAEGEEAAKQQVKWPRGGQYRVAATLKDEAGHEVEGVTFTTVRGDDFEDGRGLRFDDLELLVQRDEYEPGEEVELTVNTNRAGGTVGLFLRVQNGLYTDPLWLKMDGKSTVHRFKLTEEDQPNIYIEAFTVSDAKVHQVTRQIVVPPTKRIATVELETSQKTYLPREGSQVKLRVKDQNGKPFVGRVVLTAYDKALEYISGGENVQEIRTFFWGWKRNHQPQLRDSLRASEVLLRRAGDFWMEPLGQASGLGYVLFGNDWATQPGAIRRFGGLAKSGARRLSMTAGGVIAGQWADLNEPAAAPAAPAEALAGDSVDQLKFNAGPGQAEGPQPLIRSNLADSAVWVADLTTDENGEGVINFAMPDNLTTWKLRSWVLGRDTQVGEATVEVITRKNLMVRLQAPRFFVEKDEVVISANVHNELEEPQDVRAVLELEGGVLERLEGPADTAQTVAAHGERRFDWRVKVTGEGEAKVRVKALAAKDSDAMEMTFPAFTHGMLKTDAWSLALRPNEESGKIKLRVPEERKPEQSRLEVRYSPTLAMALVDALPYLVDYPYGCTEQTLNRFVPTVVTLGVLKDLKLDLAAIREKRTNLNAQEIGDPKKRAQRWKTYKHDPVFDEDEVKKMAKTGIDRLAAMRGQDGGWGWFPGGRESNEHITCVVLHGLRTAERAGMEVNDGITNGAVQWLKAHEAEELRRLRLPEKDNDHKRAPDNVDALVHGVLVEYESGDGAMREFLYSKRNGLSRYALAQLGLACHQLNEPERRDMCLRNLRQFLKQDDENQTAWLELPNGGWWWYWYEDQIETQAAYLRLLISANPADELAPRLAKYLLNNRRNGTWWHSTRDTAAVIEALAAFIKASGEAKPDLKVEVAINGEVKKTVAITPENLFSFDGTLVLEGDELQTGEHTVELRKTGKSPLYANAYLTVFSKEDMIPPAGLEVKVRRKFYRLIEEKPKQLVAGARGQVVTQTGFKYRREELPSETAVRSGDLIEVELTVESKTDYEYVIIEDMKPAGFEPVEVQSGWTWEALPAYKEFRDEKVAFFAERLPRGTHNLSYRVKAEIPGRFSALPAKAEAMYAPELRGNSAEWKARIEE
jgi:uncharacterized protein YfaS (alpha-2-macroglobulin family)